MTVKFKESIEFEEMKHGQLVIQVWGSYALRVSLVRTWLETPNFPFQGLDLGLL